MHAINSIMINYDTLQIKQRIQDDSNGIWSEYIFSSITKTLNYQKTSSIMEQIA